MINTIQSLVSFTKAKMTATGIQRLSIGQQTVVKIAISDFVQAFGHETKCYKLGSQVRIDVDGITFCADDEKGIMKEDK